MKQKSIKIDHLPEKPVVYLVCNCLVCPDRLAEVFTSKHAALERANAIGNWVVQVLDLEVIE